MKLKKTLAALTAALTLSVTLAVPTVSNAAFDFSAQESVYDNFIASLDSGEFGEKIEDGGFFAELPKGQALSCAVSYDVYYKPNEGDDDISLVTANCNYVGFYAELTDYYKEHYNELLTVVKEFDKTTPFDICINYPDSLYAGFLNNEHHIEEVQELCNALKEKGVIKSFIGNEGIRKFPFIVCGYTKGRFWLDADSFVDPWNEDTFNNVLEFLNSKGIEFTVDNSGTRYTFNLETEMTLSEQLKLMRELDEATNCGREYIILESAQDMSNLWSANDEVTVDMYDLSPATAPESIYGDVDQNGDVTLADAVSIVSYIANPAVYPLTEAQANRADVENTGDGINTADALAVQSYLLESVESLPVSYAE